MTCPRELRLAALACAAVKGMEPVEVGTLSSSEQDVECAQVTDTLGRSWVIRAARSISAGARLETEARLTAGLSSMLSFAIPQIEGSIILPDAGRAQVYRTLPGAPLQAHTLTPADPLTASIGTALAAIHDLPVRVVADLDLPMYAADDFRNRRLAELDRAATTGHVPVPLLERWEQALQDAKAWQFTPCVVHGDIDADSLLVGEGAVSALAQWGQARIADPADDFAWLVNSVDADVFDAILAAYRNARREVPDRDLVPRARLSGEMALVRWLLHGNSVGDAAIVNDAIAMLAELEDAVSDEAPPAPATPGRHADIDITDSALATPARSAP